MMLGQEKKVLNKVFFPREDVGAFRPEQDIWLITQTMRFTSKTLLDTVNVLKNFFLCQV